MHKWHLPLLITLSILQPIFSEHSSIDGRQCCINSKRSSTTEEGFVPDGEYRHRPTKTRPENLERNETKERIQREMAYYREQRHTNERIESHSRVFENYSTKYFGGTAPYLDRGVRRANSNKIINRKLSRIREEPIKHERNEPQRYSRDDTRDKASSSESNVRRDISRRMSDTEVNRNREERNINERNEPNEIKNTLRHSRDETRDTASPLERSVRRDISKRISDTKITQNREERSINVRNELIDIRNTVRYSRDEIRDTPSSSERGVRRDISRRMTDTEVARNHEERNMNVRNEPNDVRNTVMYSRDETRDRGSSSESGVRKDISRRMIDTEITRNREEQNMNVRNEPNNNRKTARHSRDESRNRASPLERTVRRNISRRMSDTEITRNREERNMNVGNEPNDIRNSIKYSRGETRDIASTSGRGVRRDISGRITDIEIARNLEKRNMNVKNEPNGIRNTVRYSRDETRDTASPIERGVRRDISRRMTATEFTRNCEERNMIERNEPNEIRRITETEVTRNREERMNIRNEPNEIGKTVRYFRDKTRDKALSSQHGVRRNISRRMTETEVTRNRENRNLNVRNEPNDLRNTVRYSSGETRERASPLERSVRRDISRTMTETGVTRNREERNMNVRNEPNDIRNIARHSRDETRYTALSSEHGVRRDISRRMSDAEITRNREERNMVRNEPNDISNTARHSRDESRDKASTSGRGVCSDISGRMTETEIARNREERHSNERNELNDIGNTVRRSRDETRDMASLLERGVRRDISKRKTATEITRIREEQNNMNERNEPNENKSIVRYSRGETRDRASSSERGVRRDISMKITGREMAHNNEGRNTYESSITIHKTVVSAPFLFESSHLDWQYLLFALQPIYIIGILMHEKVKSSSTAWLTTSPHYEK